MGRSRGAPARSAPRPKPAPASASASSAHHRPAQSYSAPPPAPHASAPPPAMPQSGGGGGMFSGLMGAVVQGAAMGTGSAMAHRAVDSMMGPRTVQHEHVGAPEAAPAQMGAPMGAAGGSGPCGEQVKGFTECMTRSNGDMSACQWYFDAMQQCKLTNPYAA